MNTVSIGYKDSVTQVDVSEQAARQVRADFNPSMSAEVDDVKALSAALLTRLDQIAERSGAARECAIAKTHIETAAMFGVKAATSDAA